MVYLILYFVVKYVLYIVIYYVLYLVKEKIQTLWYSWRSDSIFHRHDLPTVSSTMGRNDINVLDISHNEN